MYQKFTATEINIDNASKKVIVGFTFDLDEESINNKTVYITDDHGDVINTQIEVSDTFLSLSFTDEIIPNKPYFLVVTKEVRSLLGASIYHAIKHEFSFETTCRAKLRIVTPTNFEEIKDSFSIKWEQIDEKRDAFAYIRKEVSFDHLFENILDSSQLNDAPISGYETGKLYIRIRAENSESDYGEWSDPVTINYENTTQKTSVLDDDLSAIFQRGLQVLTQPDQGETPISFLFEFDSEIDPKSIEDNIIILQRKI